MPVLEIVFRGNPTQMRDHTCNAQWITQTFTVKNVSANPVHISNYVVDTQAGHNVDRNYDIYNQNLGFSLDPQRSTIRGFRLKDIGDPPARGTTTQATVKLYFGAVGNFESNSKTYDVVCPGPVARRKPRRKTSPGKKKRAAARKPAVRRSKKAVRKVKAKAKRKTRR